MDDDERASLGVDTLGGRGGHFRCDPLHHLGWSYRLGPSSAAAVMVVRPLLRRCPVVAASDTSAVTARPAPGLPPAAPSTERAWNLPASCRRSMTNSGGYASTQPESAFRSAISAFQGGAPSRFPPIFSAAIWLQQFVKLGCPSIVATICLHPGARPFEGCPQAPGGLLTGWGQNQSNPLHCFGTWPAAVGW